LTGTIPELDERETLAPRGLESRVESRARQKQDWLLKWLQGGWAHALAACAVVTLCCFHRRCWEPKP
jgi:hypothetical protein